MLKILRWEDYPGDDIAAAAVGKPYLNFPDDHFAEISRGRDLFNDEWFKRVLLEVDIADVPMVGVIRDLRTNTGHSIDKVSTGVKVMWMLKYFPNDYTYPSQWLGENCFQLLLDLSVEQDIVIFDDSGMLYRGGAKYCMNNCHGQFQDFKRGTIYTITPGEHTAWQFQDLEDDEEDT